MPVSKIDSSDPYRVDKRATIGHPRLPTSHDVHGGPDTDFAASLTRVNDDRFPAVSGTIVQ